MENGGQTLAVTDPAGVDFAPETLTPPAATKSVDPSAAEIETLLAAKSNLEARLADALREKETLVKANQELEAKLADVQEEARVVTDNLTRSLNLGVEKQRELMEDVKALKSKVADLEIQKEELLEAVAAAEEEWKVRREMELASKEEKEEKEDLKEAAAVAHAQENLTWAPLALSASAGAAAATAAIMLYLHLKR